MGGKDALERKISTSQKYKDAKSTLDTGTNVLNTRLPEPVSAKNIGENYKRVKAKKLRSLIDRTCDDAEDKVIVIDVRDEDEYKAGRITCALHYPPNRLNHSVTPFLEEMFAYKNKEGKRIVAYDHDDSHTAHKVASLLFEKGIDNIFVLTGGLAEYARHCSDDIVGIAPTPGPAPDSRPVRAPIRDGDSVASARHSAATRGSIPASNASQARYGQRILFRRRCHSHTCPISLHLPPHPQQRGAPPKGTLFQPPASIPVWLALRGSGAEWFTHYCTFVFSF